MLRAPRGRRLEPRRPRCRRGPVHGPHLPVRRAPHRKGLSPLARLGRPDDGETINSRSVDRVQAGFWRTYVHIGVLTYVFGSLAALAYFLDTPHGPHRGVLVVLGLLSIVAWIVIFWWVGIRLVETRWRTPFFAGWTVSTLTFIAVGAILDGGTKSPTSFMLVLPLLFAGLAYPPRTVFSLTGVAVAAALCVGLIPTDRRAWATVLLATGMFVAGLLTTSTARHRQRLVDALVTAASTDWLTGAMTRRGFYERLDHELARAQRYGGQVSVILADLDNLKRLNDSGGHEIGDEALHEIADALRSVARSTDFVGRLGGDEFALLLPGAGAREAVVVSERLLQAVRDETPTPLTASLGVAEWQGPAEDTETLLHRADAALFSAKRAGRDCYFVSEPGTPRPAPRPAAAIG